MRFLSLLMASRSMLRAALAAAALAGLAGLAGCASVTPYAPAVRPGAQGFSETRLEPNRYALIFNGNASTAREQVENGALYRAAELTLAAGFDHFIVAARATDADSRTVSFGPRFSSAFDYWGYDPRFGWRPFAGPYWGSAWASAPWRDPFRDEGDARTFTSFKARLEFVMAKGAKPADNPQAFDAAAIKQSLDNKIIRPAAK
jgi:hypothetical protein